MANGLALCGWVEQWQPDIGLQTFRGLLNGLNFDTSASLSVEANASLPGGLACVQLGIGNNQFSPASALLTGLGQTQDFLFFYDWIISSATTQLYNRVSIGENAGDGFGLGITYEAGVPASTFNLLSNLANGNAGFSELDTVGNKFVPVVFYRSLLWWTFSDKTLHLQNNVNDTTEYTLVIPEGVNPVTDPTNQAVWSAGAGFGDPTFEQYGGQMALCQAPIPDATQRALLFAGLPFSQFDSGAPTPPVETAGGKPWMKPHNFPTAPVPYPQLYRRR
jgi:hypothetical protein